ncbi:MAG: DUF4332 domain-containing protein [Candidatus Marinimicrobia bacterium]|nr:DUF4332 domain-containing protein [Candidatus Neomarinimicrobiota bacterium]
MLEERPRHLQAWWWVPGLIIFGFGLYAVINDIPRWNIVWYILGWYGYLPILDSAIYQIQGHSFFTHRRREMADMFFWSIIFWFLFEAYNFIIQNWYYVYAFQSDLAQGVFSFIAFATVFPACFFHTELIKAVGLFENSSVKPINVNNGLRQFTFWFGLLCIILPILFPTYAFWMVWGALLGVPDAINYKNGAPSILGDLERGKPGRLYQLLAGGLIAGVVWEGLNYFARCKWIYTVPGLEEWKIFEMPVLGFIGFPVLAVEAFAAYTLFNFYFRGGKTWERLDAEQSEQKNSRWYVPAAVISIVISALISFTMIQWSLTSRRVDLVQLDAVDRQHLTQLEKTGIHAPEQLYDKVQQQSVAAVAEKADIDIRTIDQAYNQSSLLLHKGMGIENARLLNAVGILHVKEIIPQDARVLHDALVIAAEKRDVRAPRLMEVHVWHRAAVMAGETKR